MSRISKIIKSKRGKGQKFISPPLNIPVGAAAPETASQAMARLMLNSGVISRDDYEKMLGVRFDIDNDEGVVYEDDVYDYEDDFKLSVWSEYEREGIDNLDSSVDNGVFNAGRSADSGLSESNSEIKEKDSGVSVDGKEKSIEVSASAESSSTAS